MERAHGVQTGHHWGGRTSPIVCFTFIYVLTAVAIALPAWMGDTVMTLISIHVTGLTLLKMMLLYPIGKFSICEQMALNIVLDLDITFTRIIMLIYKYYIRIKILS